MDVIETTERGCCMIKVVALDKQYRERIIFKSVTFQAFPGTISLLFGESGVGKSTFLEILAGLEPFQKGRYYYQGGDLSDFNDEEMSRFRGDKIGYIPQDFALIDDYTVAENMLLPSLYRSNMSKEQLTERVNFFSDQLGINDLLDEKVKSISGGQKQRVAIARALIGDYAIFLADEPTANLDKANFNLLCDLFIAQKDLGKIVVIATHDERLKEIADEIYCIKNLQIVSEKADC